MNVNEYMRTHGITDADLDAMAEPYESGDYPSEGGEIHIGSHLEAAGKQRVTVIYDVQDTQKVAALAQSRGVKPAEIYRDALEYYLAAQA